MIIFDSTIWIAGYNQDDSLHKQAKEESKEFMQFYRSGAPKGLSSIDASLLLLSKKHTVYTFDKRLVNAIEKSKK